MAVAYDIEYPDGVGERWHEIEAKGVLAGATIIANGTRYMATFYDSVRLAQDVEAALRADGSFVVPTLVVLPRVTRQEIAQAVDMPSRGGFVGLRQG